MLDVFYVDQQGRVTVLGVYKREISLLLVELLAPTRKVCVPSRWLGLSWHLGIFPLYWCLGSSQARCRLNI